ncbi:MAG: hypothetical protein ACR2KB_12175 [Chitinophagaceae bacterium]|jgi:hypothetical protein
MQEQNFEKQVHKLMDDLVIQPSTPVWDKVEEQIRRKKDRRRIVFWLLPILLISTGFLWWMISSENKIDTPKLSDRSTTSFSQDTNQKTGEAIEKNIPDNNTSSLSDPVTENVLINKKTDLNSSSITKSIQIKESFNHQTVNPNRTITSETNNNENIVSESQPEKAKISNVLIEDQSLKNIDTLKSDISTLKEIENEQLVQDSSIKTKKVTETQVPIEKEILEKQVVTAKQIKWKIVPYLAGGFSNISKGLFDPVASADFAGTPGNTSGSGSFFPPSLPEKGPYFSAGLRIIKNLNDRFEISTGIQYSFFSTKINIGTGVINDTTISYSNQQVRLQSYYQNGNTNKYTNNFHFISLPVAIEYQLLKYIPLSLHAGVSLNRLVSTNALLNNSNSSIQFENDKAWNKTQLHSFSGLQFHFFKNKSFSFKAGPFLQYSLTPLEKNTNRKQFLSVAGLQTQFYFQNKK